MNAYELRFQMVQTARDMLEHEYHAKAAAGQNPVWPTLDQVLERADALNRFVSDK